MVILNIRTFVYQGLRTIFALGSNTPGTERTVFGYLAYVIETEYAPDWSESYGYRAAELVYDILERIPDDAYEVLLALTMCSLISLFPSSLPFPTDLLNVP